MQADAKFSSGPAMDLPASVIALGEQLRANSEIALDPALLQDANVFAAERERIFFRPFIAVDHENRLAGEVSFFRCDAAPRGLVVTREAAGRLHALRNICLHAGYPVCEEEVGAGERLVCLYHGWEYTLDGRLVEPELSSRIDPARLRLLEYPLEVCNGLILVDPSGKSGAGGRYAELLPAWLASAKVTGRTKHSTTWNWKFARQFLQSSPGLFFADAPETRVEFGPLCFMLTQAQRALLFRIVPRFAEQTDFYVIEMIAEEARVSDASAADPDVLASGLRDADTASAWFDRILAEWYWLLMSAD
jgi:nitrite reductase/ring-hydroxylating ferredoxin subunit